MALIFYIKFAVVFLLVAGYMRGIKCDEVQEVNEILTSSDDEGRSATNQENINSLLNFLELARRSIWSAVVFARTAFRTPPPQNNTKPKDCAEIQEQDASLGSGIYEIWPHGRLPTCSFSVFCDMDDDGGGWTVIQRRGDFDSLQDYFDRNWTTYKKGFGDLGKDFWLGNDNIFVLTNQRQYSVKFVLEDWEGNVTYAAYEDSYVEDEGHNYIMHATGYRGNAGDSFSYANGVSFSTPDRENDRLQNNCEESFHGGWWYSLCDESNLNGLYLRRHHQSFANGVNWEGFQGLHYSLKNTEIKFRPKGWKTSN